MRCRRLLIISLVSTLFHYYCWVDLTNGKTNSRCVPRTSSVIIQNKLLDRLLLPHNHHHPLNYVHIWAQKFTHTHTHIHTHTHSNTVHVHTCTHVYTHMHTCRYTHKHTYARTHARTHTHIMYMDKSTQLCAHIFDRYTHMHMYTHTHTLTRTHTYTHTHTHTHTHTIGVVMARVGMSRHCPTIAVPFPSINLFPAITSN